MAVGSTKLLALATLVMVGVMIFGNLRVSAKGCGNDLEELVSHCKKYVARGGSKGAPSAACCDVVRKANLPCVCSHVTGLVELWLDTNRVFDVVESCGVNVPHGTKCGSITHP